MQTVDISNIIKHPMNVHDTKQPLHSLNILNIVINIFFTINIGSLVHGKIPTRPIVRSSASLLGGAKEPMGRGRVVSSRGKQRRTRPF